MGYHSVFEHLMCKSIPLYLVPKSKSRAFPTTQFHQCALQAHQRNMGGIH